MDRIKGFINDLKVIFFFNIIYNSNKILFLEYDMENKTNIGFTYRVSSQHP
jgi:hypothetical protein